MMTSFDRRPITPGNAGDWATLLAAIQDADGSDEYSSEADLLEEFSWPGEDFTRGSIAIYDGRTMVGYGVLTSRSEAEPVHDMRHKGGVHPSYRGRGLGAGLLDWAEQTAVLLHADHFPGRPLSLSSGCLSSNAGAVALHEQRGYQPVRWFHSMVRDLLAAIPRAVIPAGVQITGYTPDLAEHARLVRNEAFRDHWGSTETSAEMWAHFLASTAFRPEFSFLAYAGSEPLGMLISREHDAYNTGTGLTHRCRPAVRTRGVHRGPHPDRLPQAAGLGTVTPRTQAAGPGSVSAAGARGPARPRWRTPRRYRARR
jgi:GNAT superfamily N-acetyltransferase